MWVTFSPSEAEISVVQNGLRGQRIGTALIRQAQESARERGAKFARVDTFSFRARPFYLKMGFKEVLTLESYPRTHERIYFRKTL
ncbi:GNAT family N-acetyltransferase [Morganella morganii]